MLRALRRSVAIRALLRNAGQFAGPPQNKKDTETVSFLFGGDKRDRTADLLTASQANSIIRQKYRDYSENMKVFRNLLFCIFCLFLSDYAILC